MSWRDNRSVAAKMLGGASGGKANAKDEAEATEMIRRIDDLLEETSSRTGQQRYAWAADTLEGIRTTIERTRRVSEGQRRAVENIEATRQ